MSTANKLVTIAENQQKVYSAGAIKYSPKETVLGEIITITDILPFEHNMDVELESRNIINFFNTNTIQAIKYFTSSGAEANTTAYLLDNLVPGKSYTVSFAFKDDSKICTYLYGAMRDRTTLKSVDGTGIHFTRDVVVNNPYTFVARENCDFFIYRGGSYRIGATDVNKFSEFQIEVGETPTPYTPFVNDLSNAKLYTLGKNWFKSTNYTKGTINASTGVVGESATVKSFTLTTDYIYLKSGDYVVSNIEGANLRYIAFYDLNKGFKSAIWTARAKTFKFTATEDCYVRIDIERDGNVKIDNFDIFCDEYQFMLELGTSKTTYEPYIEPTTYTQYIISEENLWSDDNIDLMKQLTYFNAEGTEVTAWGVPTDLPSGNYVVSAQVRREDATDSDIIYGLILDNNNQLKREFVLTQGLNVYTVSITIEDGDVLFFTSNLPEIKDHVNWLVFGQHSVQINPILATGMFNDVKSIYPSTTLITDIQNVIIKCEYNKDVNMKLK